MELRPRIKLWNLKIEPIAERHSLLKEFLSLSICNFTVIPQHFPQEDSV